MIEIRIVFINIFSFFKRLVSYFPQVYKTVVYLPILVFINRKISRSMMFYISILIFYICLIGKFKYIINLLPFFLCIIYYRYYNKLKFKKVLSKIRLFFLLALLYGLSQKIFGYRSFELFWLKSNLSITSINAMFLASDIRPFSFFSGIPEFSYFVCMYIYYYATKKKKIITTILFAYMFLIASRGLLIAVLIAFVFTFIGGLKNKKPIVPIILNVAIYMILIMAGPLLWLLREKYGIYIFTYGTFNARIVMVINYLSNINYKIFLFGGAAIVQDNLVLSIISNIGFIGFCIVVLIIQKYFFKISKDEYSDKRKYFFLVLAGYSLYSDVLYSMYFMFNYAFSLASSDE